MDIQQPERSYSGAPVNTLDCSRGQHLATTRLNHDLLRQLRRVARQLALATSGVVIALAATGCSISGEPDADYGTTTEPSTHTTRDGDDLVDDDQEGQGTNGTGGQEQEQDEAPPLTPTPQELVGTWHNDPDGIDWYLTFTADGTYALYSADLDVYDEGYVDTSDGRLHLITATGDTRPAQLVVPAEGCDWKVDAWELYGYAMTQLQLCDRAAWVMG